MDEKSGSMRAEIVQILNDLGPTPSRYDEMDEPLLSTRDVAAILRCSDRTVRVWADAGRLRCIRTLGGRRLFPQSSVVQALEQMVHGTGNGQPPRLGPDPAT